MFICINLVKVYTLIIKQAGNETVCIVQSAVTISIPHDGVVKKLMYAEDDTAIKDKPLLMIEVAANEGVYMYCTYVL